MHLVELLALSLGLLTLSFKQQEPGVLGSPLLLKEKRAFFGEAKETP